MCETSDELTVSALTVNCEFVQSRRRRTVWRTWQHLSSCKGLPTASRPWECCSSPAICSASWGRFAVAVAPSVRSPTRIRCRSARRPTSDLKSSPTPICDIDQHSLVTIGFACLRHLSPSSVCRMRSFVRLRGFSRGHLEICHCLRAFYSYFCVVVKTMNRMLQSRGLTYICLCSSAV